ncbi:GNAT family N-acetyltransferase [Halobacillus litoralis]|uniref:GNAT family N-acetyltransferase n=1 Tax=Halobacillus litoralis TaxID=45668 RepID=UPI0039A5F6EC
MLINASKILMEAPYMLSTEKDVENLDVLDIEYMLEMYDHNPNYVQFIAEVDDQLVGAIDFKNGDNEKIKHQGSFGMTVLPEYRNCGIGRALLESLVDWGRKNQQVEKICLEVMEDNIGAVQLYRSMNFFEEGRKVKGVKMEDKYQDLILMALFV